MATTSDHRRPAPDPWSIGFGAVTFVAALLTLLVWIPNDIAGGFIDKGATGKPEPGDAFFPMLLAGTLLTLSIIQLLGAIFKRNVQNEATGMGKIVPEKLTGRLCSVWAGLVGSVINGKENPDRYQSGSTVNTRRRRVSIRSISFMDRLTFVPL